MQHKYRIKNIKINLFRKSSALVYALVIMSVVLIILISMLGYITSQLNFSGNRVEREKAFQTAEAGIYFYRWYLAHEVSGKTAQEINDFWQGGESPLGVDSAYENEFRDPDGVAIGRYRLEVERPDPDSTMVIAKSTGWTYKMPEVKRIVQVRFRRPSWSEYAVLANDFMRFGEGTEVYGRIHSNKGIRFDGLAYNIVSSLMPTFDDPDHSGGNEFGVHTHVRVPPQTGVSSTPLASEAPPTNPVPIRNDVFLAGRQFPVPEVSFNGALSDLNFMKQQSNISGRGIYFDDSGYGRHIILKTNGTMDVKTVNDYDKNTYNSQGQKTYTGSKSITNESAAVNYNIPENGIIFVEDNVWVEGTINNKKVTIAAANLIGEDPATIYIGMNNILYTNFDGRDIIGLVAQKDVDVIYNSLDFLTIDAALLAQSGRVGRDYYGTWCEKWENVCQDTCCLWHWCYACNCDWVCTQYGGDHRDTITVNGSIATNKRYGFAYTDGSGYTNRILNFDNNLVYFPPPFFPTGTEYAVDLWEEL